MIENMDLFTVTEDSSNDFGAKKYFEPLAQRMRPKNFSEFIGQEEAVGNGRFLRKMMEQDQIPSLISWSEAQWLYFSTSVRLR